LLRRSWRRDIRRIFPLRRDWSSIFPESWEHPLLFPAPCPAAAPAVTRAPSHHWERRALSRIGNTAVRPGRGIAVRRSNVWEAAAPSRRRQRRRSARPREEQRAFPPPTRGAHRPPPPRRRCKDSTRFPECGKNAPPSRPEREDRKVVPSPGQTARSSHGSAPITPMDQSRPPADGGKAPSTGRPVIFPVRGNEEMAFLS